MIDIPPGVIPQWSDWFDSTQRVRFSDPLTEEAKAWWAESFWEHCGLTPVDIAGIVSQNLRNFSFADFHRIDPAQSSISLGLVGEIEGHPLPWLAGLTLVKRSEAWDINVDAALVEIAYRRQGFATRFMANIATLARHARARRLTLRAKMENGPYTWARFGFVPREEDWRICKVAIQVKLAILAKTLPERCIAEVLTDLRSDDPRSIWAIADRPEKVWTSPLGPPHVPYQDTLGVALLAHSGITWYGALNLDDPLCKARLDNKIGSLTNVEDIP